VILVNKHLLWFSKLLKSHYNGIISFTTQKINNKIKTLRKQANEHLNDKYFFLKIFDNYYQARNY